MSKLLVSIDGYRADLRLNRPESLNAMDFEVFDLLARSVDELARHEELRVVVVSGEGRSFSSGIDISTFGGIADGPAAMIARAQAGYRALARLPIPTIAKVRGHALGAGLQLGLSCDLRIVSSDAQMGLLETNYGLIPDLGGSTLLPRLVGQGRAKKMIWLAEKIDGQEAHRIGLAEMVVPPDALDETVDDLADELANRSPTALRAVKEVVGAAYEGDATAGMDREAAAQERVMSAPDFAIALMHGLQERTRRTKA